MKKFSTSISLIVIGVLFSLLLIPTTCDSGVADFFCPALTVLYLVNLIIVLLAGYFKSRREKIKFNYIPIYVSVILVAGALSLKLFTSDLFKSRVMIEAYATEPDSVRIPENYKSLGYRLILRENYTCQLTCLYPERSCTYAGKYSQNDDTIELKQFFVLSYDPTVGKLYIIDRRNHFLKPLNPETKKTEYQKWWFEIIEMNTPWIYIC